MNDIPLRRIGVCSWSLRPATPQELIDGLQAVGLDRVQLGLTLPRTTPAVWGCIGQLARQHRVTLLSGTYSCVGEDYGSLDTIRRTGGVVPDETWCENWRNLRQCAELAGALDLPLVTFHAGFLPDRPGDPAFEKLLGRMRQIADVFGAHGIDLALETGQESAVTLKRFLETLNRANVGVNFDPANMVLYDKGDPIAALSLLAPWIRQVHIKDATRTHVPGTWGREVPVGAGEVDWPAFFATLEAAGYNGNFVIEREAGERRVPEIIQARQLIERRAV